MFSRTLQTDILPFTYGINRHGLHSQLHRVKLYVAFLLRIFGGNVIIIYLFGIKKLLIVQCFILKPRKIASLSKGIFKEGCDSYI